MAGALFPNNIVSRNFLTKYGRIYGNKSQITFAACSYEFANIIGDLFDSSSSTLPPEDILNSASDRHTQKKAPPLGVFTSEIFQELDNTSSFQ